jgi:hypothetical protein
MTMGVIMTEEQPPPFPPPPAARREVGIKLTERQLRARRARSIAIAVSLGVLVILFYIVTLVKGPGVLVRPL